MPLTFISYRREDSAGYAGRLHEELEQRLGTGQIFRDVDTLRAGQDFDAAIRARLEQCHACVVMIGPGWLQARTASGERRLDQPGDYVAMEIAAALSRSDVVVIPVLVGGATMPAPEQLPASLQPLSRRHAMSVRDETWEADMDRLAALLRHVDGDASSTTRPRPAVTPTPALRRYAVRALVAALGVLAILTWLQQRDNVQRDGRGATEDQASAATSTEGVDGPTYAIDVPATGGEISHGDLIYTVLSGSVQRRGSSMRVWLRVRGSNEGFTNANFWDDSFRLVIGGQAIPASGGLNDILEQRSIRQAVVRFDVPTISDEVRLRVSYAGQSGEVPIDLSGNGSPPRHEDADPRDALSHAVYTSVVRNEMALLTGGDISTSIMRITRRAFVNKQRVTAVVKWTNMGRYDVATGDLVLRLAAGGEVLAPAKMPSEVVAPDSTYVGDVTFDVPPDIATATLQATLRDARTQQTLTLR